MIANWLRNNRSLATLNLGGLALYAMLAVAPVEAAEWSLTVRSATKGEVRAEQIQANLTIADDGAIDLSQGRSRLWVGEIEVPAQRWQLSLRPKTADSMGGEVSLRLAGGPAMAGSWSLDAQNRVQLSVLKGQLKARFNAAQDWSFSAQELALAPWRELIGGQLGWTPSTLAGELSLELKQQVGTSVVANGNLFGVAFDSVDGLNAGADISADFELQMEPQTQLDLNLTQGELLLSPAYLAVPKSGLNLQLTRGDRLWRGLAVQDGVLDASFKWPDDNAESWELAAVIDDLAEFQQRYGQSVWEAQGWPPLQPSGHLQLRAVGRESALTELDYELQADKLVFAALEAEQLRSTLKWQRGALGQIDLSWTALGSGELVLGPAQLSAGLSGGVWTGNPTVANPTVIDLLQGRMRIAEFSLDQRQQPWQANAALGLVGINLPALCRAFGWVEMPGVLTASFPSVLWSAERVLLSGGAQVQAFQGQIDLGTVEIEHPFGVSPAVTASASFNGLDLAEVTSAFDFGEITGRLNGTINDLRVVGGKPVAFDAQLRTDPKYRGKRQISQRAVNNLSSVGGAGGGALSRSVLRVFDRFRYDAIGLGCRLRNGVCAMTGLEADDGGFIIVRGSGLPRITVKGHAQRVDWDSLVARLIAATAGAAPTVE